MVHRLEQPGHADHAAGLSPMTASLRYRCACRDRELLNIQVIFDSTVDEAVFLMTMKQLWRDMQTEIAQHLVVQP